ncbi:MAG: hypothetical protein KDB44_14870 [Mycobacterium sp.]|nr:hypothetical protein [Mycobacterium sp.]
MAHTQRPTKPGIVGFGALAFSVAALTFGAGIAGADPNDPGMTNVRPDGTVSSRQAAATSGARHCAVNPGTLNTTSTVTSDIGVPTQKASEAGPKWVGSNGWQAIGLSPSNPWRGNFNDTAKTGPQCKKGRAGSAGRF